MRHHPELSDAQVSKLIGTTKQTIAQVRDRTHWNTANLRPRDPVLLGLCTQTDLNAAILKARKAAGKPATLEPLRSVRNRCARRARRSSRPTAGRYSAFFGNKS